MSNKSLSGSGSRFEVMPVGLILTGDSTRVQDSRYSPSAVSR